MTRKPAHTEQQAMTFWSVFEAKHGLRQPEAPRPEPPAVTATDDTAETEKETP